MELRIVMSTTSRVSAVTIVLVAAVTIALLYTASTVGGDASSHPVFVPRADIDSGGAELNRRDVADVESGGAELPDAKRT